MKLLVIGGSRFLGRHLVAAAQAGGHDVTLFNRGRSAPVDGVEMIEGDRNTDLDRLEGRRWDAVIDTCGYFPRAVAASAKALADSVDRYVFISSLSVYADHSVPGNDENARLGELTEEQQREVDQIEPGSAASAAALGKMYGPLKVVCERAVEQVMPGRVLQVRPGLIVGEGDYSDRFTYWVTRVARGGEVLAPGRPDRFLQMIDVADLARWTIRMTERKATGVYTANGAPGQLTMKTLLEECRAVSGSDASFTWVDDEFLLEHKVGPWMELPLWIPDSDEEMRGFMYIDCSKALAAGLETRPISETIRDTLAWHRSRGSVETLKAGLAAGKEEELLRAWHAAKGA